MYIYTHTHTTCRLHTLTSTNFQIKPFAGERKENQYKKTGNLNTDHKADHCPFKHHKALHAPLPPLPLFMRGDKFPSLCAPGFFSGQPCADLDLRPVEHHCPPERSLQPFFFLFVCLLSFS